MKSAVETLSPTRAKLTVEVPFSELKPSLDAAYKKIAQQINIPGFRRGKVPSVIIDRQIGRGAVLDEAINEALPKLYVQALQDNELEPLAQPEVDITRLEDNETLEFTAEVDIRPQVTLPELDGIEVSVSSVAISDQDVEEEIQELRERFGTLVDVDRPAAEGDFVVIDLEATQDGELVEGGEASAISYQVGKGGMLDGLDEALAGLSAGDTTTFTSTLAGGQQAGQDVQVEVTVSGVKQQELPELDEEFVQMASEFDTMEELTQDVRTRLAGGKRLEQAAEARDAVVQKLLDVVEVPVPDTVVSEELQARRQNIEQQLSFAGMSMEQYLENEGQTQEEFDAELERQVREGVATQFILDQLAKDEEIGIEQQELSEHMMRRAQQSGQNPQEYIQHALEHNHVAELVAEVVRGKALATIVESATVTDESGAVVDLKNLRGDGTLADPDEQAAEASDGTDEAVTAEPVGADDDATAEEQDATT